MGPKGPSHITPPVTKVKKLPALVTRGLSAASTRRPRGAHEERDREVSALLTTVSDEEG